VKSIKRTTRLGAGLWPAAVLLLSIGAPAPSLADATWPGAPDCEKFIDLERIKRMLSHREPDGRSEVFGFYPATCGGGLYLVDPQHQKKMWRINVSWQFDGLESVAWIRESDTDKIVVIATYFDDGGKSGGTLFRARIVMTRDGGGPGNGEWSPLEPEILP